MPFSKSQSVLNVTHALLYSNLRFQITSFNSFVEFCGKKKKIKRKTKEEEGASTKQIENVMAASVINQK